MLRKVAVALFSREVLGSLILPAGVIIAVGIITYRVARPRPDSESELAERLEHVRDFH